MTAADSVLRFVYLYPGLLGRYGHQGDLSILAQRCRWRGVGCELLSISPGEPIPQQADLYVLAGGESPGLATMAQLLQRQRLWLKAVERGAVLFAVGSVLPLLGKRFITQTNESIPGLGLLDLDSQLVRQRRFGPVVGDAFLPLDTPLLGFEDHHLSIRLGADVSPLSSLRLGFGQGGKSRREGVWRGHIVGTSLRGPVLALNPALADWLLFELLGPLTSIPMLAVDRLRERFLSGMPQRIGSKARR